MAPSGSTALALGLATGAGLATSLGAAVVFVSRWVTTINKRFLAGALALSAGVMLMVSLTELYAEALDGFVAGGLGSGDAALATAAGFFGGFALVVVLDGLVHSLEHATSLGSWAAGLAAACCGGGGRGGGDATAVGPASVDGGGSVAAPGSVDGDAGSVAGGGGGRYTDAVAERRAAAAIELTGVSGSGVTPPPSLGTPASRPAADAETSPLTGGKHASGAVGAAAAAAAAIAGSLVNPLALAPPADATAADAAGAALPEPQRAMYEVMGGHTNASPPHGEHAGGEGGPALQPHPQPQQHLSIGVGTDRGRASSGVGLLAAITPSTASAPGTPVAPVDGAAGGACVCACGCAACRAGKAGGRSIVLTSGGGGGVNAPGRPPAATGAAPYEFSAHGYAHTGGVGLPGDVEAALTGGGGHGHAHGGGVLAGRGSSSADGGGDESAVAAADAQRLNKLGVLAALAIALHNLPEGVSTFSAAMAAPSVGVVLAVAIALHNVFEGVVVAVPIYFATRSRWRAFAWGALSGMAEPVGALLAYAVIGEAPSPTLLAAIFAVVSGMMTWISLTELLPTARAYDPDNGVTSRALAGGMVIMAASLVLFAYQH